MMFWLRYYSCRSAMVSLVFTGFLRVLLGPSFEDLPFGKLSFFVVFMMVVITNYILIYCSVGVGVFLSIYNSDSSLPFY
jgi:hypothetical protein